jgi:hypothetical protein
MNDSFGISIRAAIDHEKCVPARAQDRLGAPSTVVRARFQS